MQHAVALAESPPSSLVLGRYRPLKPLGSGGSGSVWLARDESSARDVALKVVPREGKAGCRAEREVEAATRLRHPRCLKALALDRDDDHVYVAYEYVRGKTLRQAMREGRLGDDAAVEAAAQVLEGLAHAHGRKVVHRDVKPSNIMLEEAEGVSIRLLDFGLALLDEAETITAAGDVPGTLAYISPERLKGEEATGAADVWATGVILWESLVGWHPFAAGTPSPVETAKRIARGAPPLAKLRPDLPRALCATVDRMLELDPARRPSAKHLAGTLRVSAESRARRRPAASSLPALGENALPAVLAATLAGGATTLLPFFPRGWPLLLAALAGIASLRSPRAGLALALAAPVLPLGNLSLGLTLLYAALATGWLLLFLGDPRTGLLWCVGPLLGPLGALPLAPVIARQARGPARRAALAGATVLAAAGVAALTGSALPFRGVPFAGDLAIPGEASLAAVASSLAGFVGDNPVPVAAAIVLAAAAIAVPRAERSGAWGVAVWGSAVVALLVLLPPLLSAQAAPALPTVLGVWAASALLAFQANRAGG